MGWRCCCWEGAKLPGLGMGEADVGVESIRRGGRVIREVMGGGVCSSDGVPRARDKANGGTELDLEVSSLGGRASLKPEMGFDVGMGEGAVERC